MPVPVELVRFSATAKPDGIALTWSTATERNNRGFAVERSGDLISWTEVAWLDGAGDADRRRDYQYLDVDVVSGQAYYYRLRQRDRDGASELSHVLAVTAPEASAADFPRAYPSLVAGDTVYAELVSPRAQRVRLEVYAFMGQRVITREVDLAAGPSTLSIDVSGAGVGLHVVCITFAGGRRVTRRFMKT